MGPRVVVIGGEVFESPRLSSLVLERLASKPGENGFVIVASPPPSLELMLWRFLHTIGQYGINGLAKRLGSHFISIARVVVVSEREAEVLRGEVARLSDEVRWLSWGIASTRSYTEQQAALLLSYPVRLSAALTASALRSLGVEAVWLTGREAGLISAGGSYLDASIDYGSTLHHLEERLSHLLEHGTAVVLAGGVVGALPSGVRLLGWGGEVLTGLIVARVLGASQVEVIEGEKPFGETLAGGRPEKVCAEAAEAAARARILRLPQTLRKHLAGVKLIVRGVASEQTIIIEEGECSEIVLKRNVNVYMPGAKGKGYCRILHVAAPTGELAAGIPVEDAALCTKVEESGERLATALLLVGTHKAVEAAARECSEQISVGVGRLQTLLCIRRGG